MELIAIGGLFTISIVLVVRNYILRNKMKKILKYKIINDIMVINSKNKNIFKNLKKINSLLIKELKLDYSSFFLYDPDNGSLQLKDTNILDYKLIKKLSDVEKETLIKYDNDFDEAFNNKKTVRLSSKSNLNYPTAFDRNIRNAVFMPLIMSDKILGFWLIESCNSENHLDIEETLIIGDQIASLVASGTYIFLDSLMKIPKRDFFLEFVNEALEKDSGLSVVFADIDHFKKINDTYGHEIGDEVLKAIGNIFNTNIKGQDMIARYGGEEIVLALSNCNKDIAEKRVDDIRKIVENTEFSLGDGTFSITCSFGVASYPEDFEEKPDAEEILRKADERVYKAKDMGRNRVVVE